MARWAPGNCLYWRPCGCLCGDGQESQENDTGLFGMELILHSDVFFLAFQFPHPLESQRDRKGSRRRRRDCTCDRITGPIRDPTSVAFDGAIGQSRAPRIDRSSSRTDPPTISAALVAE